MVRRSGSINLVAAGVILGGFCYLLAGPSAAAAGEEKAGRELSSLVAKVDPCVVTILMQTVKGGHAKGSGFVIDADGVIATNYHVIEGAKEVTITFPDKTSYPVKGYRVAQPNRDMALLVVETQGKRFPVLRLAANPPTKGERVFAFGAPLGMSGSMSEGIVAAVRGGEEVRGILREMSNNKDVYKEQLGYDTDIEWIQTTTPISPGNSGGPLVNGQGEVVGINTWQSRLGQNLNFTLSAKHLQQLIFGSGRMVNSFNMLPEPRQREEDEGSLAKTLSAWKQLNRLKNELSGKLAPCEKGLAGIAPIDPRNPMKGYTARMNRKAKQYHTIGAAYTDFAAKVKAIKNEQVNPKLLVFTIAEAELAQRMADTCEKISSAAAAQSEPEVIVEEANYQHVYQHAAADIRLKEDALRREFSLEFHKEFPTLEQTAREPAADESESAQDDSKGPDREELRNWSDNTGVYHIQAKFRGLKDGKLSLERADGKLIVLPVERLSDADRKFIGADK